MVPPQVRGRQTITWMAPENSLVEAGETVIRLDANYYKEQIQKEQFEINKLKLQISDKTQQLKKEKSELLGQLNITSIEKELADVYAARDEKLYPKNKIIEDAINLDYLKAKSKHYKKQQGKLEEKARAELQILELKRKTHQVKVDQFSAALDSLEIKAPHDGLFIYQKNWRGEAPRIGMSVWSGRRLGKLPNLEQMEAKIFVLESEAAGLKKELPVSIVLDSKPDMEFSGKVANVDAIAKPIVRRSPLKYFQVKVNLESTDGKVMKPGSQVKATMFVQKLENVVSVPNQALFFEQNNGSEKTFVNIKTSSGYEKQEVKIGVRSLTRTVVTEGLNEGQEILLGKPHERE
jgi:multidrug efflux pump subunit AcrA (membrane-fusion protein)